VLAVVEHEEQPLGSEEADHRVDDALVRLAANTE
jgi:hypothetical protein